MSGVRPQNDTRGIPTAPYYEPVNQYSPAFHQPQIHYLPQPAPIIVFPPSNSADTWPKRPFGWKRANWYFTGMAIIVTSCVGTVIFYANDGLLSLFSVLFTVGFFVFTVPCLCCCGKPIGMTATEQRENDQAQLEMLKRVQTPQTAPPTASNNMPYTERDTPPPDTNTLNPPGYNENVFPYQNKPPAYNDDNEKARNAIIRAAQPTRGNPKGMDAADFDQRRSGLY
jgi:hypothetical protein